MRPLVWAVLGAVVIMPFMCLLLVWGDIPDYVGIWLVLGALGAWLVVCHHLTETDGPPWVKPKKSPFRKQAS